MNAAAKTAGVFLIAALACAGAHAEPADATITKIQGDVELIRNGSASPAKEGTALAKGDVVKTGGGTADFTMNGLAGCRVLPGSECSVADPAKKTMTVRLANGKAVFNLEKMPAESSFKVETPTAVAAVRGTQFLGSVVRGASTFSVRDDAIEVIRLEDGRPMGDPVVVQAGFSLDVTGDGFGPLNPRPATGGELTAMEQVGAVKTCA